MCVLLFLLLLASVFSLGKLYGSGASHRVWLLWTQLRSLDDVAEHTPSLGH